MSPRPSPRPRRAEEGFFARVWAVARRIPPARVATYGQLAALVGQPRGARAVGWAMRALPTALDGEVPWHRVVAAGGRISQRPGPGADLQRRLLRREGVRFVRGAVDLRRHAWISGKPG